MRKFTVSFGTDSDSTKSSNSSQLLNENGADVDLPKITTLHISLTELRLKTSLKVIGDAVLCDVKNKLLKSLGSKLSDPQNMGLFQPSEAGKMGKFLEEERLLSEYTADKKEIFLEFIPKHRLWQNATAMALFTYTFPKDVHKTFLRYVYRGDHKKVSSILSKGFDPNFQCPKTGETPLTLAVMRPKPHSMISALIAGGAHRDFCSRSGMTALHKAAIGGNFEAVKSLLDFGQSPNTLDRECLTPLYHNIVHDQDTKICHSLLYEHSVLGISDKEGLQEIHQAARLNRVEHINLLLMYGADVNSRCNPKQASLHALVKQTTTATPGDTPLHVAAAAGQRSAVLRLLSWGADPSLVNQDNLTAMQVASYCGHGELAEVIHLYRGSSTEHRDSPFLPAPTYNPNRRIRRAPANSYITEPTPLTNIPQDHSRGAEVMHVRSDDRNRLQRATSENNIAISKTEQQEISQNQLHCCNQLSPSSAERKVLGTIPKVCGTLTLDRRLKYAGKEHVPIGASQHTICNPNDGKTREISNLTRQANDQFSNDRFLREGSQTDSGISNSSTEKQNHLLSKVVTHSLLNTTAREQHNEHSPTNVAHCNESSGQTGGIRPSVSCMDARRWRLQTLGNKSTDTQPAIDETLHSRIPRTVVLQKAPKKHSDGSCSEKSYGLSLRTAKSPELISAFSPTSEKPSLQTVIRVVEGMPAYKAGIRDGDFVIKVNGIDVTRFSHDEVVRCLSSASSESVCLTVIRSGLKRSKSTTANQGTHPHVLDTSPITEYTSVNRFNCQSKIQDDSGISSARSSDRTTYSSLQDDRPAARWSDESSSIRGSPYFLNPTSEIKYVRSNYQSERRQNTSSTQRIVVPRSRTICGLAATSNPNDATPTPRSFYFARNPHFHRIGSQDSRSSRSSETSAVVSEPARTRCSSTRPCDARTRDQPKVTLIKAEKNAQKHVTECVQQQVRVYPAHRSPPTLVNPGHVISEKYSVTEMVLPPPMQFR